MTREEIEDAVREVTDIGLEAKAEAERRQQGRRPLSGWIGDYSAEVSEGSTSGLFARR